MDQIWHRTCKQAVNNLIHWVRRIIQSGAPCSLKNSGGGRHILTTTTHMALIIAGLCAALSGCTDEPSASGQPAQEPYPIPSTSSNMVPTDIETAPTDVPDQYDNGLVAELRTDAPLVLDDEARRVALAMGTEVMRRFARRDIDADTWYNELVPYLTIQAALDYKNTDPANVPPTAVTGEARLTPASSEQVARVSVPTNAGVYLVILSRNPDLPDWRADRIMPPEGYGDS